MKTLVLCAQNFGRRAVATARHLTQKSKQMMSTVGLPLSKLPGMVQPVCDLAASSVADPVGVSEQLHIHCSSDLSSLLR